jgi:hypothetical protein
MLCALGKGSGLLLFRSVSFTNVCSFNSYTQQICIDDAVVIDPERAENVITNDGTTMRILAEKSASPSVWNRQREVISDGKNRNPKALHLC